MGTKLEHLIEPSKGYWSHTGTFSITNSYHARFQIEFNFRDARQFFGLSNFKNIKKQQVQNVIGYAFFMVALSNILILKSSRNSPIAQAVFKT